MSLDAYLKQRHLIMVLNSPQCISSTGLKTRATSVSRRSAAARGMGYSGANEGSATVRARFSKPAMRYRLQQRRLKGILNANAIKPCPDLINEQYYNRRGLSKVANKLFTNKHSQWPTSQSNLGKRQANKYAGDSPML